MKFYPKAVKKTNTDFSTLPASPKKTVPMKLFKSEEAINGH